MLAMPTIKNEACPHRIGAGYCMAPLGHKGLHTITREFDKPHVSIETLWDDMWLPLSAEAELQIGGNSNPFAEA
jgi:hypothetical protein